MRMCAELIQWLPGVRLTQSVFTPNAEISICRDTIMTTHISAVLLTQHLTADFTCESFLSHKRGEAGEEEETFTKLFSWRHVSFRRRVNITLLKLSRCSFCSLTLSKPRRSFRSHMAPRPLRLHLRPINMTQSRWCCMHYLKSTQLPVS